MKNRIRIALFATFLSVCAHYYLATHYYPLKFGFSSGQSICNLSGKFDCDAVSASNYSAFLGIPIAVWGLAFNSILFLMILLSWLEWSDNPERLRRWTFVLTAISLGASLVMGLVSTFLVSSYCIFCLALYVLSLITFMAFRSTTREPVLTGLKSDLPLLASSARGIAIWMLAVPVASYMIHQMFLQSMTQGNSSALARAVQESVDDWQNSPKQEFVAKPTLVMGPSEPAMTVVEFADFRCSHCKAASYSLHAFMKAHPEVRFEFYSYPLDGACNEKIPSSSGISCRLAGAAYCAEKEGKGWDMHRLLFDKQESVNVIGTVADLDIELSKSIAPLGLNWDSLQRCMDQPETMDAIKAQAKQGALVNVQGTPTLFANGKLLTRGMMVPVLQGALERVKSQSKIQ